MTTLDAVDQYGMLSAQTVVTISPFFSIITAACRQSICAGYPHSYVEQGLCNGQVYVCLSHHSTAAAAAGLLLRAARAGNINRQLRAPNCNGTAAARRSEADAGSALLTTELKRPVVLEFLSCCVDRLANACGVIQAYPKSDSKSTAS